MIRHKAQAAVLGAGPAGAIAALQLGRAGIDVLMIDADAPHRGHLTESFPASGAPLAGDIGILDTFCACSSGPAAAMQMVWRDTPETRVFEGDGPLLLDRQMLHEELRGLAARQAKTMQARVREVTTKPGHVEVVTDAGQVQCAIILDARGRRIQSGARKRNGSDLTALPFTASAALPAHSMCLEAVEAGWIWATSQTGEKVYGAIFQRASVLSGLDAAARHDYLNAILSRSKTLNGARQLDVRTPNAAGLSMVTSPLKSARHILIGDAALARDPIASHGLVHALRSAVQGAIAAQTILDPDADSHAAFTFLDFKHAEAVRAAKIATQQAYRDQSLFQTPFWSREEAPHAAAAPSALEDGPVTLASPLTRAPTLGHDRIGWKAAIELPTTRDFWTGLGPINALDVATACRPAATLSQIATRLGRQHDGPTVFKALEHLTLGGAFIQARRSI